MRYNVNFNYIQVVFCMQGVIQDKIQAFGVLARIIVLKVIQETSDCKIAKNVFISRSNSAANV